MGIFGWSLPPGCSHRDIDEAVGADAICDVCAKHVDDCICPECPKCGEHGHPLCYMELFDEYRKSYRAKQRKSHGLDLSYAQLISRAERNIADAVQHLDDMRYGLELLKEKAEKR